MERTAALLEHHRQRVVVVGAELVFAINELGSDTIMSLMPCRTHNSAPASATSTRKIPRPRGDEQRAREICSSRALHGESARSHLLRSPDTALGGGAARGLDGLDGRAHEGGAAHRVSRSSSKRKMRWYQADAAPEHKRTPTRTGAARLGELDPPFKSQRRRNARSE